MSLPVRVLQFGEGNFLRGFIDWMLQEMNDQGIFNGKAAVVVPIPGKKDHPWVDQNCAYTLVTRGVTDGQIVDSFRTITSIDRILGAYEDFDAFMDLALSPDLELVVSNTTEAGIAYVPSDRPDMCPPASYPAKLAVFLHKRFAAGLPGLIILPCELIENNGGTLKKILLQYAEDWGYEPAFRDWLENSCSFISSLVDRIVTGYPRDPELRASLAKAIGHEDPLMDIIEPYHLFVLEPVAEDKAAAIAELREKLPFTEAGLNVVWTEDLTPYRTRKVRILNGAHTSTSLAALLAGLTTVEDFMKDPDFSAFLTRELKEEILPTIDLPEDEKMAYTDAVLERFLNPYLNHQLKSIALNSVSKWKTRLLPTLKDRTPEKARCICFSLAALLAYYVKGLGQDSPEVLDVFQTEDLVDTARFTRRILSREDLWGEDLTLLPKLYMTVAKDLSVILKTGVRAALPK